MIEFWGVSLTSGTLNSALVIISFAKPCVCAASKVAPHFLLEWTPASMEALTAAMSEVKRTGKSHAGQPGSVARWKGNNGAIGFQGRDSSCPALQTKLAASSAELLRRWATDFQEAVMSSGERASS